MSSLLIKRTRLKIVVATSSIVTGVVLAFCVMILLSTYSRNETSIQNILNRMVEDRIKFPMPPAPLDQADEGESEGESGAGAKMFFERINAMRGFTIVFNEQQEMLDARFNEEMFTKEEVESYVNRIRSLNVSEGKLDSIRFLMQTKDTNIVIAVLDTEMETSMFNQLVGTVCLTGGIGIIVLFGVVWFLSYWIVKPASDAFTKQKRFISEAGHELKTPITVISASIDLLQKSGEDSERWISNIKEQVKKLSVMTGNLLELSRVEEMQSVKCEFNLSNIVVAEALSFESVAFENGKTLELNVADNIVYKGDVASVRQAVGILCDNAIKHGTGEIRVGLKCKQGKPILSVSNLGEIDVAEQEYLFERFYRGSESRAKTEGAGLGLAILKALSQRNGWKLSVTSDGGRVTFNVSIG